MMKILFLNYTYDQGSTGKIVASLFDACGKNGFEPFACYAIGPKSTGNLYRIAGPLLTKYNSLKSHLFGNYGFEDKIGTKRLIKYIDRVQPDLIHIHNIHFHDVNLRTLSNYLQCKNIKVLFTFHDCWLFTGYCPYYPYSGCNKWQAQCTKCPIYKNYSFFFDKSKKNHCLKKESLSNLNYCITAPSKWLGKEIKKAFCRNTPIKVIYNGINQNIFKPTESDFRKKYNLENKTVILGVAFDFDERKGIGDFIKLAKDLPNNYQIVLVGKIKTNFKLPKNIICIERTTSQTELAELYSAADIFVNPTKAEVLGMVNIEAMSCGTPVITYDSDGAGETVDNSSGILIRQNDYAQLLEELLKWKKNDFDKEKIIEHSKNYSDEHFAEQYIQLYKKLLNY